MARLDRLLPNLEVPLERRDPLEELGDEAIIAQQTEAHLPQKRASVASEARSVVISQPAGAGSTPYSVEHGEATVVVRDRRSFNAARDQLLSRGRGVIERASLLWAAVAVTVFAAGGLLAFLSMRAPGAPSIGVAPTTSVQGSARPAVGADARRAPSVKPPLEQTPRQVRLEELPLERPNRR